MSGATRRARKPGFRPAWPLPSLGPFEVVGPGGGQRGAAVTVLDARRWSNYIFAGLFVVALVLFFRIIVPFLMPVLLGGFLVVLFFPVQEALLKRFPHRRALCSAVSTFVVACILLVPLAFIGWMVARELLNLADGAQELLDQVDLRRQLLANLPRGVRRYVRLDPNGAQMERMLSAVAASGAVILKSVVEAGTELLISLFLMIVAMYYFFMDGRRLLAELIRLVPLDRRYIRAFFKEFADVAHAIVYGNTLTAIVQGALGFVGLLLADVPHAGVWASAMVIVAFLPVGGTALVWGPIGLLMLVAGKVGEGLFVLAWGTFLVGSVDNVIRPRLVGSRMALHPLLVFLSIFGGLAAFGVMGLLVGPLIAAIFMAMVRIYRRDFLQHTQAVIQTALDG